ncbi:COG4223 family protein [Pedomonas mirosovicensis]|uniref:COG4223 family protein n=1 Tax=Pedomonas mirosovicensis TaxID=2908641 RepID=UPI0021674301|nr:hypothetical protein [Pedomonas mirosovicensis]MCH8683964.1 hypothetical protein [Pedomonas mirosovicensis]
MSENNGTTKASATGGPETARTGAGDAWTSARAEAIRRQSMSDQPRRGGSGWPWAITGIAIAFAAGLLANPWFEAEVRSHLPEPLRRFGTAETGSATGASGEQLARLEARLAALESRPAGASADLQPLYDRLAQLEARPGALPAEGAAPAVPADASLSQRVANLEARLATLDQTVTTASAQAQTLQNAHAQLDSRLTQFTAETKAQLDSLQAQGTQARTLVLVAAIRRALDNGQPIGGAVGILSQSLGSDNANVTALQAVAEGAPTLRQLRQRLASQKPTLLARAAPAASTGPWYERIGESLKSLVQVRRADQPAAAVPGDVASQLDTMDRRLAQGDLSGALAVSEALPQAVRGQMEPLLRDMRALVAARQALSRIEAAALAG